MKTSMSYSKDLMTFIEKSTSPYHSVIQGKKILDEKGFKELNMKDEWQVEKGGKYYVIPYSSMIIAFTLGEYVDKMGYKIIISHTDSPSFKIKPVSEIKTDNYITLNTEVYGGPVYYTWFDRPLSLAGKVALKSDNPMKPLIKYIDFKKSVLTIPSLAIHMNREVNKGVELSPQKDTLPLIGQINKTLSKDNYLVSYIAKELGTEIENILDFDLYLYLTGKGNVVGINEEFVQSSRLDDLAMVYTSLVSIANTENKSGINIAACFDNEEIGSRTKQGADSVLFSNIIERISMALSRTRSKQYRMLEESFIISADAAHALHPNAVEKNDPTNRPVINEGIVLKLSAKQSYATDCESTGTIQQLCDENKIPYQKFVNHSCIPGGKTLGPVVTAYLPIKAVDVGVPMLAMHSINELVGVDDLLNMSKLFDNFYAL
ncbi:putative M18 family aminopeptidase 2 [Vallitalea longa]|uniref:M18 family aminopeptidase n=1 Tax=Vallitalea longa TaxID=2936439 RepID=A0A9W6DD03_9FIRM|nr:M18 family aminopeptidase [Vallitalea longa]GKX27826.1 putative M18 family aminopeptidase 2 [Vallitalea longa]